MKRRTFLAAAGAAGVSAPAALAAAVRELVSDPELAEALEADEIDPYFLDPGEISRADQAKITELARYHEAVATGRPALQPRGGRPRLAPTYRFLHWDGELGSSAGKFVGPLSLKPGLEKSPAYSMNAQILHFHASTEDWRDKVEQGALTIELRARAGSEPMTWLFAEQFGITQQGDSTLGLGFVVQRQGIPMPVTTDGPNVDFRIQLMRRQKPGLLGKIFRIASMILAPGAAIGQGEGGAPGASVGGLIQSIPAIRIPQLVSEGVAFCQALLGSAASEAPIWRSGFNSYGLSPEGSRMRLRPGLWVIMDETRQNDMRRVQLADVNGKPLLIREDKPIEDTNYLVLDISMSQADPATIPPSLVDPEPEPQPETEPGTESEPGPAEEAEPRTTIRGVPPQKKKEPPTRS